MKQSLSAWARTVAESHDPHCSPGVEIHFLQHCSVRASHFSSLWTTTFGTLKKCFSFYSVGVFGEAINCTTHNRFSMPRSFKLPIRAKDNLLLFKVFINYKKVFHPGRIIYFNTDINRYFKIQLLKLTCNSAISACGFFLEGVKTDNHR